MYSINSQGNTLGNDIRLDTSEAKEEHISNGNKLGIIDRLVRTLRELILPFLDMTRAI